MSHQVSHFQICAIHILETLSEEQGLAGSAAEVWICQGSYAKNVSHLGLLSLCVLLF